ncbi:MAG: hypothetical protein ACK4OI_04245, partial [Rhizobium oryzihabitans]
DPPSRDDDRLNRGQCELSAMDRPQPESAHNGGECAEIADRTNKASFPPKHDRYLRAKVGDRLIKSLVVQNPVRKWGQPLEKHVRRRPNGIPLRERF